MRFIGCVQDRLLSTKIIKTIMSHSIGMMDACYPSEKIRLIVTGFFLALALLLLVCILNTLSLEAGGEEIVVDAAGGGDYTTIEDALDNSTSGDTLSIKIGDYDITDLSMHLKAGVTLIGEDRNETRLRFQSPGSPPFPPTPLWPNSIRLETINFTSTDAENPNAIRFFGENASFINCTFTNMDLECYQGNHTVISNNTFLGPSGLSLYSSIQAVITGNTFQEDGLLLDLKTNDQPIEYFRHTIANNTLGGRPIIYWLNRTDSVVPEAVGQVILVNCTNITASSLDLFTVTQGISLIMTSDSVITDSTFRNITGDAIVLKYSRHNDISNSIFLGCRLTGISTFDSVDTIISGCAFRNCTLSIDGSRTFIENSEISYGIGGRWLKGIMNSGNLGIINTTISGFRVGIFHISGELTIIESEVSNNHDGIDIDLDTSLMLSESEVTHNTGDGITANDPDRMTIWNSRISNNDENGIELDGDYSTISDSVIQKNGNAGILVKGRNNVITDCRIENNSQAGVEMTFASHSSITNCTIENNHDGITITGTEDYSISLSSLLNNEQDGIKSSDGSHGTIQNSSVSGSLNGINLVFTTAEVFWCTISDNINGINAYRPPSDVNISWCLLLNNTGYGISTPPFNAYTTMARYNYWGSPSGPMHIEENPDALGDRIGDAILFSPWYQDEQFTSLQEKEEPEEDEADCQDLGVIVLSLLIIIIPIALGSFRFWVRGVEAKLVEEEDKKQKGQAITKEPHSPQKKRTKKKKKMAGPPDDLTFASIASRTVAAVIDGIYLLVILFVIFMILAVETESANTFCGLFIAIYIIIPIEFFLFTEGYSGQSPGKSMSQVKLMAIHGKDLTFSQAFRSAFSKGFLYPFFNIIDAAVGIFGFYKETQQRISQYNADLIVVAVPKKKQKYTAPELPDQGKNNKNRKEREKETDDDGEPTSDTAEKSGTVEESKDAEITEPSDAGEKNETDQINRDADIKELTLHREIDDDDPPPPTSPQLLDSLIRKEEREHIAQALIQAKDFFLQADAAIKQLKTTEIALRSTLAEPNAETAVSATENQPGDHPSQDQVEKELNHERISLMENNLGSIPDLTASLYRHSEELLDSAFDLPENHDINVFMASLNIVKMELESSRKIVESTNDIIASFQDQDKHYNP